jgi:hypothetical protein
VARRTLVASDDFNRAAPLGSNWTNYAGTIPSIDTNQIIAGGSGVEGTAGWNADAFDNDQYSKLTVTSSVSGEHYVGVGVRLSDAAGGGDGYDWDTDGLSGSALYRWDNGSTTTLDSSTTDPDGSASDTMMIEIIGALGMIWLYINDVIVDGPYQDSTYASGDAGIYAGFGSDPNGDDWEGGDVTPEEPYIYNYTYADTAGGTATSETVTKPSGVEVGDLLMMIGLCDANNTADWNDLTSPDVWTTAFNDNSTGADANLCVWWRIADGGEAASETVTGSASLERSVWYLVIKNVDSTPINVTGAGAGGGNSFTHAFTALTTSVANCLCMFFICGDGGDMNPYSITTGTDWFIIDDRNSGAGGTDVGGCWGIKVLASAGGSGALTLTSSASDGSRRRLLAIQPPQAAPASTPYYYHELCGMH